MSTKISPPFGYFGSKNRLSSQLCKDLPMHDRWIEPFCGSAAITLAKAPASIEIISDINDENNEEFHVALLTQANKSRSMIFISGYESDLYNDMLLNNGWEKKEIKASTRGTNGIRKDGTELV